MAGLRRRGLESLLDARSPHVRGRPTGVSTRVTLPDLPTGRHMLAWMRVREHPPDAHWDEAGYDSVVPWICEFHDVQVHGDAGIVRIGDEVVADTLWQTDAARHRYTDGPDGVVLQSKGAPTPVTGTCLSLLNFNHDNYYHWTIDTLGRLAAADAEALDACQDVLVPEFHTAFQADGFALTGLGHTHAVRTVAPDETLAVERMIVPWSITCDHRPHPCIRPFFGGLAAAAAVGSAKAGAGPWPRRLYIDRRGGSRPLANEDEVVAALAHLGFQAVRLETLPLADQIALFAHAEVIVAPHGAGLGNLVYAQPGCRLVELHVDYWVNWCFRRLAAVFGVGYDCVIGRASPGPQPEALHKRVWSISLTHVLGAVETACSKNG